MQENSIPGQEGLVQKILDFFRDWDKKSEIPQWFIDFSDNHITKMKYLVDKATTREGLLKYYLQDYKGSMITYNLTRKVGMTSDKAAEKELTLKEFKINPEVHIKDMQPDPNDKHRRLVTWAREAGELSPVVSEPTNLKKLCKEIGLTLYTYKAEDADKIRKIIIDTRKLVKTIMKDNVFKPLREAANTEFTHDEYHAHDWKSFMCGIIKETPILGFDTGSKAEDEQEVTKEDLDKLVELTNRQFKSPGFKIGLQEKDNNFYITLVRLKAGMHDFTINYDFYMKDGDFVVPQSLRYSRY